MCLWLTSRGNYFIKNWARLLKSSVSFTPITFLETLKTSLLASIFFWGSLTNNCSNLLSFYKCWVVFESNKSWIFFCSFASFFSFSIASNFSLMTELTVVSAKCLPFAVDSSAFFFLSSSSSCSFFCSAAVSFLGGSAFALGSTFAFGSAVPFF